MTKLDRHILKYWELTDQSDKYTYQDKEISKGFKVVADSQLIAGDRYTGLLSFQYQKPNNSRLAYMLILKLWAINEDQVYFPDVIPVIIEREPIKSKFAYTYGPEFSSQSLLFFAGFDAKEPNIKVNYSLISS